MDGEYSALRPCRRLIKICDGNCERWAGGRLWRVVRNKQKQDHSSSFGCTAAPPRNLASDSNGKKCEAKKEPGALRRAPEFL